jgi:2-C-methyl-D-erythritol 2,4-cyclodiphosphate synthase
MRIGHGYDVHKLVYNRPLILGGVNIPFEKGLLGHSDADVLAHAVMDSILGAAGEYDIGRHFPDTDPEYSGADSIKLLEKCAQIAREAGYAIINIDSTLIAQKPKLSSYIDEMRKNIANACGVDFGFINVKATTEEGLGFTGTGEGIACHAICLVDKI